MDLLNNKQAIFLTHVILVGPLLTYVGYMKTKSHANVFMALLVVASIVGLYHLYRLVMQYNKSKVISYVNLLHILVIVPLLVYVARNEGNVVYPVMDLLFVLGVGVTTLFLLKLSQ